MLNYNLTMKNPIKLLILSIAAAAFLASCKKLETDPAYTIDENLVWDRLDSNAVVTQFYLNEIYRSLPEGFGRVGGDFIDAASGDAIPSRRNTSIEYLYTGRVNAENTPDPYWNEAYAGIRRVNLLLKNIHRSAVKLENTGVDPREYWKAEARFVRAMVYFELIKRYGGVPLVGDTIFSTEDNIQLPRNSFAECVNYITTECNAIRGKLRAEPISTGNWGRIPRGAALALKCRTFLYAASPLFNGNTNPLNGYTTASTAHWDSVIATAEQLKAIPQYTAFFNTALFKPTAAQGYGFIFTERMNNEIILARQRGQTTDLENNNAPVGYTIQNSNGRTSPTQNFVDAFPNADGSPFNPASTTPYVGRDPRFYTTIFYHGYQWLGRAVDVSEGGKDKPNSPTVPVQTRTGYYLRKFMGNFATSTTYSNQNHNYPIFRVAEVILNYAEALNEVGRVEDAVNMIKLVRNRAGITAGTGSRYGIPAGITQAAMRDLIRNERRIELSFEDHRFWDIRRWKIAEQVLNGPLYGVKILKKPDNSFTTPERVEVGTATFNKRLYFMPIPYLVMLKNNKLIQNEGW